MTWTMSLTIITLFYLYKITGQKMNCVYVTQPTTSAANVENPAAIFALNLERIMFGSTRNVSTLPEGTLYDLDNVPDNLYELMFCFRTQNITEMMKQKMTMRQEGQDCEKEKESRPRRQLPPSKTKDTSASDDSLESPVDDSDDDANYKKESSEDESSEPSDSDTSDLGAKKTTTADKVKAKTL